MTLDPVDFGLVIAQMRTRGTSARKLAVKVSVSRHAISRYESGSEPSHQIGERIICVWCELRGMKPEQLPRRPARPVHGSQSQTGGPPASRQTVLQSARNGQT